jgi:hypothetical protein
MVVVALRLRLLWVRHRLLNPVLRARMVLTQIVFLTLRIVLMDLFLTMVNVLRLLLIVRMVLDR